MLLIYNEAIQKHSFFSACTCGSVCLPSRTDTAFVCMCVCILGDISFIVLNSSGKST